MEPKQKMGYAILLFLIIISIIGGDYLFNFRLFGMEIYLLRVLLFCGVIWLLVSKFHAVFEYTFGKIAFLILVIWLLYGGMLLLWSENKLLGFKELFYIGFGICFFLVLKGILARLPAFWNYFERFWLIGFFCLSGFLLFEFMSSQHLESSSFDKLLSLGYYHPGNATPYFTFGNPNHLAIFLCLTCVLSLYFAIKGGKILLHGAVILLALNFSFLTESRLSLFFFAAICVFVMAIYTFRFARKSVDANVNFKHVMAFGIAVLANLTIVFWLQSKVPKQHELLMTKRGKVASNIEVNHRTHIKTLENSTETKYETVGTDYVYPIEKKLLEQLSNGEVVNIKAIKINNRSAFDFSALHAQRSVLKALAAIIILLLGIVAYSLFFANYSMNANVLKLFFVAGAILVIGLFINHNFKRPNRDMQFSILIDAQADAKAVQEIQLTSISTQTLADLKKSKYVRVQISDLTDSGKSNEQVALGGDMVRKNLIFNGLAFLKESKYLGVGPGQFGHLIQAGKNKFPTGTVDSPHNFVIEILSQYGLLVFALIAGIFLWIVVFLVKSFFSRSWSSEHTFLVLLLICLLLLGNSNSRFLSLPVNWLLISLIFIVSDELLAQKKIKSA